MAACFTQAEPLLPDQLRLRATLQLAADLGVPANSMFNPRFFDGFDGTLIEWLRQYSIDQTETYLRGFLGRMLFSGDEVYKPAKVLSGGEKVRCMLSRLMMSKANALILDQPTDHLDLESITALSGGLVAYPGNLLFASHDHQFIDEVANRIIEIPVNGNGCLDREGTFEEFLQWKHEHTA